MNKWKEQVTNIPLVTSIVVRNNEKTIFDCLQSVTKQVDLVILNLENSTDDSAKQIDNYIRRNNNHNIFVFDLTQQNPWPQVADENIFVIKSKSYYKSLSTARSIVNDGLWVLIDPRVSISNNFRQLIYHTASKWENSDREYNSLYIEKENDVFMPFMRLSSSLVPGPNSLKDVPMLYAKIGNQIGLLKPKSSFGNIGIFIKEV